MIIEACIETLDQAIQAEKNGAHRLELCSHLELDGLSPSIEMIKSVLNNVSIPVRVMVRNRPGNFIYTERDIDEMLHFCRQCEGMPIDGFVIGMLDNANQIDKEQLSAFLSEFQHHEFTFHKAIDLVIDPIGELLRMVDLSNLTHILSSGGEHTAFQGASVLKKMVDRLEPRFTIVAAGKITQDNIYNIQRLTGASQFHGKNIL